MLDESPCIVNTIISGYWECLLSNNQAYTKLIAFYAKKCSGK